MNTLINRVNHVDQLVPDDALKQINQINQKINTIFKSFPELKKLHKLTCQIPTNETHEFNPELLLTNYQQYKTLIHNVIEIQSFDINKMNLQEIEISNIIQNKLALTKLTHRYLMNLFKSLILLERYIHFMNELNEFFSQTNQELLHLMLIINEYETTHY